MRVNIIGGGVAGCMLAYMLKKEGAEPVIYEASSEMFSEVSAYDCGTYNPRYSAQKDANSEYYSFGYFESLKLFEELGEGVDLDQCGTLQIMNDERKAKRLPRTYASWEWPEEHMQIISAKEASDVAGVEVTHDCLYLPYSGVVSPQKVCIKLINGVEVKLNQRVEDAAALEGDATILACATKVKLFTEAEHLPVTGVRGQVTYVAENERSAKIKSTISYGGHISPALNGVHYMGATFQPWLNHCNLMPEDDLANISKMCERMPSLAGQYDIVSSRAGVRTASRDHFPIVGQLSDKVYVSAAHGSHGFVSGVSSAMILAKKIVKGQDLMSEDVLRTISPARF